MGMCLKSTTFRSADKYVIIRFIVVDERSEETTLYPETNHPQLLFHGY